LLFDVSVAVAFGFVVYMGFLSLFVVEAKAFELSIAEECSVLSLVERI
jgi:hypothetical protein